MFLGLKAKVFSANAQRRLSRLGFDLSKRQINKIVVKVAESAKKEAVKLTPKRWTGNTKRAWRIRYGAQRVTVVNFTRAMRFLEEGTAAHGPSTAKRLYVPLTAKGAKKRKGAPIPRGYKRGVDFQLARRVRGIRRHHIVDRVEPRAQKECLRRIMAIIDKQ